MCRRVINWEIHDSSSIRDTRKDSQSSVTCPFVTDASTSRLQHVWPYCTHTQHWIVHNVLRLSKHDDGETSNKYQSSCQREPASILSDWALRGLGLSAQSLTVTASAGFDPTNRSDLTRLFSAASRLTAKSIWVTTRPPTHIHTHTNTDTFFLPFFYKTEQDSRVFHWWSG